MLDFYEIWYSEQIDMLIMNTLTGIDNLDPKIINLWNLVIKLKCAPIFMKFDTHNKTNILIMNIILASVASMIIGSEHGTIIRTIIAPIMVPCSEWL